MFIIVAGLFDEIYLLKKDDRISQTRIQTKTDYLTLRYNNENLHFFKNGNKYQPFNSNYSIQIEWQAQQTLGKLLGRGRRATCFLRYKEKLVCRFVIEEKEDEADDIWDEIEEKMDELNAIVAKLGGLTADLKAADTAEKAIEAIKGYRDVLIDYMSMRSIATTRYNINTRDPYYLEENKFFNKFHIV